ncbi:MAG TPA: hypothetical protein VI306_15940 [Pyrinomonadaceae bacterium]
MKLALKYGLTITAGVILWTIIAHTLVPNPQSLVHSLGAFAFFNILQFSCIFLGIKALEREQNSKPTFKEGIKQGVSISFVYAITAALYFAVVLLVIGTRWMAAEARPDVPMWLVALQAFAGLTIMAMLLGLVYSTLISFVLARRLSEDE